MYWLIVIFFMKTDNFKLSFHHEEDNDVMHYYNIYTKITFGNSLLLVTLLPPFFNCHTDEESFKLVYYLNNHVNLTVESSELPPFLRAYVRNLFYGHFQYFCTPFYNSPALECVGYLKSIRNYLNRKSC